MKKRELELALRHASRISGELRFILIGSQAIHGYCLRPPPEVLLSQECDIYPVTRPETANFLANELGRQSLFARKHGFYVDVVTPEIASLPEGWQKRLKKFQVGQITALCLEVHDLLISKLDAGRLKDLELVGALLKTRLANANTLGRRLARVSNASTRARTRRQLRTVLQEIKSR